MHGRSVGSSLATASIRRVNIRPTVSISLVTPKRWEKTNLKGGEPSDPFLMLSVSISDPGLSTIESCHVIGLRRRISPPAEISVLLAGRDTILSDGLRRLTFPTFPEI